MWLLCRETMHLFPWITWPITLGSSILLIVWLRFQQITFPFRKAAWQIILQLAGGGGQGCLCEAAGVREEEGNDTQNKMGSCLLNPPRWNMMVGLEEDLSQGQGCSEPLKDNMTYLDLAGCSAPGLWVEWYSFPSKVNGHLLFTSWTLHSNITLVNSVASIGE